MGPIPRGRWRMVEWRTGHPASPSGVIRLEPMPGTIDFDRTGFLIHGDNTAGNASRGCIIVNGTARRLEIWNSGDNVLEVVP